MKGIAAAEKAAISCIAEHEGKRFVIGYSGGADSHLLLHSFSSALKDSGKILAIHVNHGLNRYADQWQQHCVDVCAGLDVPCVAEKVVVQTMASPEAAARVARYQAFAEHLLANDVLVLGQHKTDQAETLLFRLMRGTGVDGLAGIRGERVWSVREDISVSVVRPFLSLTKEQIIQMARKLKLDWIEDDSNQDETPDRNYIRHKVLPLLEKRWPTVVKQLAGTAELTAEASDLLRELADLDLQSISTHYPDRIYGSLQVLDIEKLLSLSRARQMNVLRQWLRVNQSRPPGKDTLGRLIDEICRAKKDAEPQVVWAGYMVSRYQGQLISVRQLPDFDQGKSYKLSELKQFSVDTGLKLMLGNDLPEENVQIRFRQGGEKCKINGQSKMLKKLFQEQQVLPWLRSRIPLLYEGGDLKFVCGLSMGLFDYKYADQISLSVTGS